MAEPSLARTDGFLDPRVIARIGSMELKARTIVEGFLHGLHRSPHKGFSVEFAEYRQYMPGDDLASIDWKVYARSDRYFVKKFEEETNLPCHVLLDVSRSMGYGSTAVTKLAYGSYLAASLAYLMTRQRDAVGLITFDERVVERLPPSSRPGHLRSVLLTLERTHVGHVSNVSKPLHQLADAFTKRGLVVVISDLLDDPVSVVRGLRHVRFRGMDVIVFHVLDHAELTFPFERATRFRDSESAEKVLTVPGAVREDYLGRLRALIEEYGRELQSSGVDYCLLDTSQPLDHALSVYLATRERRL
ncbi:MAG: DUF58 domain-containing protein [Vicinamibacterales bacterium]